MENDRHRPNDWIISEQLQLTSPQTRHVTCHLRWFFTTTAILSLVQTRLGKHGVYGSSGKFNLYCRKHAAPSNDSKQYRSRAQAGNKPGDEFSSTPSHRFSKPHSLPTQHYSWQNSSQEAVAGGQVTSPAKEPSSHAAHGHSAGTSRSSLMKKVTRDSARMVMVKLSSME